MANFCFIVGDDVKDRNILASSLAFELMSIKHLTLNGTNENYIDTQRKLKTLSDYMDGAVIKDVQEECVLEEFIKDVKDYPNKSFFFTTTEQIYHDTIAYFMGKNIPFKYKLINISSKTV